jgi:hypothetical protein
MRYTSVRHDDVIIRHMRVGSRRFASTALMLLVINLSGDWAFQPGDDSRWSRPDFDDSHWRIISTQQSWQDQGVSRPRDFFWYRLHVRLPLQRAPVSLLFGYSAFPYEV